MDKVDEKGADNLLVLLPDKGDDLLIEGEKPCETDESEYTGVRCSLVTPSVYHQTVDVRGPANYAPPTFAVGHGRKQKTAEDVILT